MKRRNGYLPLAFLVAASFAGCSTSNVQLPGSDATAPVDGSAEAATDAPSPPSDAGTSDAGLRDCAGKFTVKSDAELDALRDCRSVGGLALGGAVTSLQALSNLNRVDGSLEIRNTVSLVALTGLEKLGTVTGSVEIRDNKSLGTLSALRAITSIGGYFEIRDNAALKTLGMSALKTVGGYLEVIENAVLPQCEATKLATQVSKTCDCSKNDGVGDCK